MRLFLFLLSLVAFSCENPPEPTKAERMAQAVCNCTQPLLDLNKNAAQAPDKIDFDGIQIAFEQARICIAEQRIKPEDMQELEKALAVKCPQLSAEQELWMELLGKQ